MIADAETLEDIVARLRHEIRLSERGNVRIYRLCGHCEASSLGIGNFADTDGDGPALIL